MAAQEADQRRVARVAVSQLFIPVRQDPVAPPPPHVPSPSPAPSPFPPAALFATPAAAVSVSPEFAMQRVSIRLEHPGPSGYSHAPPSKVAKLGAEEDASTRWHGPPSISTAPAPPEPTPGMIIRRSIPITLVCEPPAQLSEPRWPPQQGPYYRAEQPRLERPRSELSTPFQGPHMYPPTIRYAAEEHYRAGPLSSPGRVDPERIRDRSFDLPRRELGTNEDVVRMGREEFSHVRIRDAGSISRSQKFVSEEASFASHRDPGSYSSAPIVKESHAKEPREQTSGDMRIIMPPPEERVSQPTGERSNRNVSHERSVSFIWDDSSQPDKRSQLSSVSEETTSSHSRLSKRKRSTKSDIYPVREESPIPVRSGAQSEAESRRDRQSVGSQKSESVRLTRDTSGDAERQSTKSVGKDSDRSQREGSTISEGKSVRSDRPETGSVRSGKESLRSDKESMKSEKESVRTARDSVRSDAESGRSGRGSRRSDQSAAESLRSGTESRRSGIDSQRSGGESLRSDTESQRSGRESQRPGRESQQSGTESHRPGRESLQSGTESQLSGRESLRSGKESQRSGRESLQSGTESKKSGRESLQSGTEGQRSGRESLRSGRESLEIEQRESQTSSKTPSRQESSQTEWRGSTETQITSIKSDRKESLRPDSKEIDGSRTSKLSAGSGSQCTMRKGSEDGDKSKSDIADSLRSQEKVPVDDETVCLPLKGGESGETLSLKSESRRASKMRSSLNSSGRESARSEEKDSQKRSSALSDKRQSLRSEELQSKRGSIGTERSIQSGDKKVSQLSQQSESKARLSEESVREGSQLSELRSTGRPSKSSERKESLGSEQRPSTQSKRGESLQTENRISVTRSSIKSGDRESLASDRENRDGRSSMKSDQGNNEILRKLSDMRETFPLELDAASASSRHIGDEETQEWMLQSPRRLSLQPESIDTSALSRKRPSLQSDIEPEEISQAGFRSKRRETLASQYGKLSALTEWNENLPSESTDRIDVEGGRRLSEKSESRRNKETDSLESGRPNGSDERKASLRAAGRDSEVRDGASQYDERRESYPRSAHSAVTRRRSSVSWRYSSEMESPTEFTCMDCMRILELVAVCLFAAVLLALLPELKWDDAEDQGNVDGRAGKECCAGNPHENKDEQSPSEAFPPKRKGVQELSSTIQWKNKTTPQLTSPSTDITTVEGPENTLHQYNHEVNGQLGTRPKEEQIQVSGDLTTHITLTTIQETTDHTQPKAKQTSMSETYAQAKSSETISGPTPQENRGSSAKLVPRPSMPTPRARPRKTVNTLEKRVSRPAMTVPRTWGASARRVSRPPLTLPKASPRDTFGSLATLVPRPPKSAPVPHPRVTESMDGKPMVRPPQIAPGATPRDTTSPLDKLTPRQTVPQASLRTSPKPPPPKPGDFITKAQFSSIPITNVHDKWTPISSRALQPSNYQANTRENSPQSFSRGEYTGLRTRPRPAYLSSTLIFRSPIVTSKPIPSGEETSVVVRSTDITPRMRNISAVPQTLRAMQYDVPKRDLGGQVVAERGLSSRTAVRKYTLSSSVRPRSIVRVTPVPRRVNISLHPRRALRVTRPEGYYSVSPPKLQPRSWDQRTPQLRPTPTPGVLSPRKVLQQFPTSGRTITPPNTMRDYLPTAKDITGPKQAISSLPGSEEHVSLPSVQQRLPGTALQNTQQPDKQTRETSISLQVTTYQSTESGTLFSLAPSPPERRSETVAIRNTGDTRDRQTNLRRKPPSPAPRVIQRVAPRKRADPTVARKLPYPQSNGKGGRQITRSPASRPNIATVLIFPAPTLKPPNILERGHGLTTQQRTPYPTRESSFVWPDAILTAAPADKTSLAIHERPEETEGKIMATQLTAAVPTHEQRPQTSGARRTESFGERPEHNLNSFRERATEVPHPRENRSPPVQMQSFQTRSEHNDTIHPRERTLGPEVDRFTASSRASQSGVREIPLTPISTGFSANLKPRSFFLPPTIASETTPPSTEVTLSSQQKSSWSRAEHTTPKFAEKPNYTVLPSSKQVPKAEKRLELPPQISPTARQISEPRLFKRPDVSLTTLYTQPIEIMPTSEMRRSGPKLPPVRILTSGPSPVQPDRYHTSKASIARTLIPSLLSRQPHRVELNPSRNTAQRNSGRTDLQPITNLMPLPSRERATGNSARPRPTGEYPTEERKENIPNIPYPPQISLATIAEKSLQRGQPTYSERTSSAMSIWRSEPKSSEAVKETMRGTAQNISADQRPPADGLKTVSPRDLQHVLVVSRSQQSERGLSRANRGTQPADTDRGLLALPTPPRATETADSRPVREQITLARTSPQVDYYVLPSDVMPTPHPHPALKADVSHADQVYHAITYVDRPDISAEHFTIARPSHREASDKMKSPVDELSRRAPWPRATANKMSPPERGKGVARGPGDPHIMSPGPQREDGGMTVSMLNLQRRLPRGRPSSKGRAR